jgi:hypothetical protein
VPSPPGRATRSPSSGSNLPSGLPRTRAAQPWGETHEETRPRVGPVPSRRVPLLEGLGGPSPPCSSVTCASVIDTSATRTLVWIRASVP